MGVAQNMNGVMRRVPAWPVYLATAAWVAWMFWRGLTGDLGPEPINVLERAYGELALQLLVLGLLITPLRKWTGVALIKFRRAIGVSAFFLVLAHFLVWAVLDVQSLDRAWTEIVKRPYVTVGMLSLVLLLPLAVTSNNLSIRKMGPVLWRKIHWLTYPAALLAGLHYIWLAKGFQLEPLIYMAVILSLLASRVNWPRMIRPATP